jgi:hypothetical protein
MKAEKTSTIQVSGCLASELDAVEDILCEVGSCRPIIDEEFVMTDLGEIRHVIKKYGDQGLTALPLFKAAIEVADENPGIAYDEKVMFTP